MQDIPEIVRLGSQSLVDGPYAGMIPDKPETTAFLAEKIIGRLGEVLLWEEDGKVGGLLGFIVCDHHFSGEKVADEVMWFVSEEFRSGSGAALKLFWQAEADAKRLGAKKMKFTAPNEGVEALYKRLGYRKIEVVFLKDFEQ